MPSSERKRRWYYPTPGWLVFASLAAIGFLFLSDRYQWFWFDGVKDFPLAMALLISAAALLGIILWFLLAMIFRRGFQFSVRSLLLLVPVVALVCGWVVATMRAAAMQRQGAALVKKLGGRIVAWPPSDFDFQSKRLLPDVFAGEVQGFSFDSSKKVPSHADLSELVRLMPNSQTVVVRPAGLGDDDLKILARLKRLIFLHVSGPGVTDAGVDHLAHLEHLGALDLSGASITDEGLQRLMVHKLYTLQLNGTKITDEGLRYLRPHKLGWLELNDTRISDVGLAELEHHKELRVLHLGGTSVSDAGLSHLSKMTDLTDLNLSGTRVTDRGIKQLEGLTSLAFIDLSGTQITDEALDYLKPLLLSELNFADTKVTDTGLDRLAAMSPEGGTATPTKLTLAGTRTSQAAVKRLQQAWPYCKIQ